MKLFEVCRQRGIPVFTFINKLDRPARDPLGLLDEVEEVLEMEPVPVTWPLGDGPSFMGVYDRVTEEVHLFTRTPRNETAAAEVTMSLDDPRIGQGLSDSRLAEFRTNVGLLDALDLTLDREKFLQGQQTPVYFGSALTNFGARLFLGDFVAHAPSPRPYPSDSG